MISRGGAKFLNGLRKAVREAQQDVDDEVVKLLPVNSAVEWKKGKGEHAKKGIVLDHGEGERIKVQNTATGRDYWISLYDVLEAVK